MAGPGRTLVPAAQNIGSGVAAFRPWRTVGILTLAYTLGFVDRQILNLLVEPIKHDIVLSDTAVSLLQGASFTAAYILMGPLFGRWVDQGSRRTILILGITLWSAATFACGLVSSFGSLVLLRLCVGGAEACLVPAAWSLLSDLFDRRTLPRAMSVFLMGPYLGGGLALMVGGLIVNVTAETAGGASALRPWQIAFMAAGAPGLLVAAAILLIREPPRREHVADTAVQSFRLGEIVSFFWSRRDFYGTACGGMAMISIVTNAFPAWAPTFLIRHFGRSVGEVGVHAGIMLLLGGSFGVLAGPMLGRWLEVRGFTDAPLRVPAIAATGLALVCPALPWMNNYPAMLGMIALVTMLYSMPSAMAGAALQLSSPNRMRGVVTAIYVFILTLVGLGLGPSLVALTTDHLLGDPRAVGVSIALVCGAGGAAGAVLLWGGLPRYRRMLAREAATRQFDSLKGAEVHAESR